MSRRLHNSFRAGAICALLALAAHASLLSTSHAAVVSLEVLQRGGYGVVAIKRPRPNVLTILADVDGRRVALMIDSTWSGEGIGLHARGGAGKAERVVIGNVQLAAVPLSGVDLDARPNQVPRRFTGAGGIVGAGFLRACSAIVDLQNLKVYLRPPGKGARAEIGPGLTGAGMAAVSFASAGPRECLVPVEVNGYGGRMFVDTGSYLAAVDARLAAQIGARPFVTRAGHRRPQTMDEFERVTRIDARSREVAALVENAPVTPLQSLKIGGVPARAPDIRLRRFDFYSAANPKAIGVLGMDVLGANGAIIDFGAQRLYFLPTTGGGR
jgi:hypothetical protein